MDSKVVSRTINAEIRPLLKAHGFDQFSGRTTRRHRTLVTDVINVQSFNSYNASVLGVTTFSLAVSLGIYMKAVPWRHGVEEPHEYHCQFRRPLLKSQSFHDGLPRRDIWSIDPVGTNLDAASLDIRRVIESEALPWFRQFENLDDIINMIVSADGNPLADGTWGFGAAGSPSGDYTIGFASLAAGKYRQAYEALQRLTNSLDARNAEQLAFSKKFPRVRPLFNLGLDREAIDAAMRELEIRLNKPIA